MLLGCGLPSPPGDPAPLPTERLLLTEQPPSPLVSAQQSTHRAQGPGGGGLGKAGLQRVQPSIFRGNSKIKDVAGAEGKQEFFIVSRSID